MNRRSFLSSMAAAGAAIAARPRLFASGAGTEATVGLVGCGWYGGVNLESLLKYTPVRVAALCDPNEKHLRETLDTVAGYQRSVPQTFADYRRMHDAVDLDIVIVATPDHWHALPAIAAMQAGADVFIEKPIAVDVIEGEALVAASRKYNRVVQVNTQRRSTPHFAKARDEYLHTGRLGTIGLVETYCYLPMGRDGIFPDINPPAHMDYDLWTGPAPLKPFNAAKERGGWRRFMEYGNGIVGDMCVHMLDAVRWMMGLGWPDFVTSTGGIYVQKEDSANNTDTQRCVFQYPGLAVTWEHRVWGASPIRTARHWTDHWGARFIGSKGTLDITLLRYEFTPADGGEVEGYHLLSPDGNPANADLEDMQPALDLAEEGHAVDLMAARRDRSSPISHVADVHISSSCCVLANLALELGRPLRYDPASRTIPGDDEATARLARPYRAPWVHPHPDSV